MGVGTAVLVALQPRMLRARTNMHMVVKFCMACFRKWLRLPVYGARTGVWCGVCGSR